MADRSAVAARAHSLVIAVTLCLGSIVASVYARGGGGGHSGGGHSSGGHSSGGHSSGGHSSGGHSGSGHSMSGHSSSGHSAGTSTGTHSGAGHATSGNASAGRSSGGWSSGGHAASNYSASNQSSGGHSSGGHSSGSHSNSARSRGGFGNRLDDEHDALASQPRFAPNRVLYPWYNGHWHNHLSGSGFAGYGGFGYPLAWGPAGWGTGRLWYGSGYLRYRNPYYTQPAAGPAPYNYAQPVDVDASTADDAGNPDLDAAVERFQAGDYPAALTLVDNAIRNLPSDATAHELRSLILFAMQDYSQAAATIHSVLAVGPGWDWTTLCSLYPDMTVYAGQLHALEAYARQHPQAGDARFLLAYHYMTQGHHGSAAAELKAVVRLMPDDQLAADLLRMATGSEPVPPTATRPAPGPDVPPVDPATLIGHWHASRDDGSNFELDLDSDKTFTWKFSHEQESGTIAGTYTVEKGLLVLQGQTGAMAGIVSGGGDRFTFKPLGGPSDDPGLTFAK